ncbi:MAG: nicotinate (nicotinamide) nucleotide adenylyltransferase [Clostridia bacterium]|nr:nicotinate (nicotinamide) nucleotide adenylyltransferase [Clostridia bacterium]
MKTIAVFGGTFNPFHIGHEEMLKAINELDYIDEVLIIPSKIPPHKSVDFLADDDARITMCELVASKYKKARVLDIEIKRDGKSYTIDTLLNLKNGYPQNKIFLVIGGDMAASFTEWKAYKEILDIAGLIVFSRTTTNMEDVTLSVNHLRNLGADIRIIVKEISNISSTQIRNNINNVEFLERNLPSEVFDYVLSNGTYSKKYDIEKFKEVLRKNLDDYRYEHSLCVADEAMLLAEIYGANKEIAYVAGLLHDVTKNFSELEHLKIFDSFGIILNDVTKKSKKLWHAISGSLYVKNYLGVDNDEIISAIRYHTAAKSDMSLLEKIIYVADFTSADRNYPDVETMRNLSRISLEDAMLYALNYTINELKENGSPIHPDTINAYNFLLNNKGEV